MSKHSDDPKRFQSTSSELALTAVPLDQPVDDLIGSTYLGKYELLEVLGVGGMGVIYQGRQIFLDRTVAIKMLKNDLASVKARTRFHQEAKAASALKHPGIVSILDFGVDDLDRPYMVMEHVEGCTVSDLLDERMTLSVEDILPVFLEICDALSEAHKKGIVHRDLKPSNIMLVVDDDGEPHIKILDFGIAKVLDFDDRTFQDLTKTGDALGTPLYMSPEQIRGKDVTYRSDLYSLGCMLYACLTGAPPFIGESKMITMDMHLAEKPMSLHEASDGLDFPPGIEGIVMRLLEKRPEDRFSSVDELKSALIEMAARNDLIPAPGPNQRATGAQQFVNGPNRQTLGAASTKSRRDDTGTPVGSTTGSAAGDFTASRKRHEGNADTTYWKSDLSDRVKSARADKFKALPRRTSQFDEEEDNASACVEASLNKTFAIIGAVTALLLMIGAGVWWIGWKAQSAHTISQVKSEGNSRTNTLAATSANSLSGTSANIPGTSPTNLSATVPTETSSPINLNTPITATSDSSNSSIDPDINERTADEIIRAKLIAGAGDSSISLKEQDGLTYKGLQYLGRFKLLRNLDLRGTNLQPTALKYLIHVPISTLNLDVNKGVTNESLSYIAQMKDLQYLSIAATGVSDEGMKYLTSSGTILSLWLGYNRVITDQGIKNLNPEKNPLRSLFLNGCNVSDAAARDLAKFKYMFSLDLADDPKITDVTVEVLQGKANGLQCLVLANDHIGDAGIHALTHFKLLRTLDLSGVKLSPKAQAELATMTGLTNLYLVGCNLTPYEIAKLSKTLPSTTVETNNRLKSKLL